MWQALACAAVTVRVSLTASKLGYRGVHGHDVKITACYCGSPEKPLDVEAVDSHLYRAIGERSSIDLEKEVSEGAVMEDFLLLVARRLPKRISDYTLCRITAEWLWGLRRVDLIFKEQV